MKLQELCWCLCELLEPKLLSLSISFNIHISYANISFALRCFGPFGVMWYRALWETWQKAFGSHVGKSWCLVDSGSGLGLTLRSFDFFGAVSSLTDFTAIGRCVYIDYVFLCFYMLFYVFLCFYMPLYALICFYMPLYAFICFYMPLYAFICFYMPWYAFICF